MRLSSHAAAKSGNLLCQGRGEGGLLAGGQAPVSAPLGVLRRWHNMVCSRRRRASDVDVPIPAALLAPECWWAVRYRLASAPVRGARRLWSPVAAISLGFHAGLRGRVCAGNANVVNEDVSAYSSEPRCTSKLCDPSTQCVQGGLRTVV